MRFSWLVKNSATLSQDTTKEGSGLPDKWLGSHWQRTSFTDLFNLQGNLQRSLWPSPLFLDDTSIMLGRWDSLLGFSTLGGRNTELLSVSSSVDFPPLDILPKWYQNINIKDSVRFSCRLEEGFSVLAANLSARWPLQRPQGQWVKYVGLDPKNGF